jgi:hypothetical protein
MDRCRSHRASNSRNRSKAPRDAHPTALPLGHDIGERARAEALTHDHHQIETGGKPGSHTAKRLAQKALGAVALNRIADPPRSCDAEALHRNALPPGAGSRSAE